jgi:hypothetical protein
MLDPTRYALNAATVGFRKRTGQSVDWGAFHNAIQNQTDAIKVRREKQETLVSELHVMGGQRFGMEGNGKTNELARQQRQMNGYPLRSFIATGGAIVLPPKHGEGLLAIPMNLGLNQYTQYNAVVGNYVSRFVEPLNAPLENNTILLAKAGIRAQNESASDPYKTMQFNNNMHKNLEEIRANQQKHLELRGFKRQGSEKNNIDGLSDQARLLAEEQTRAYTKRQKRQEDAEGQSLPLTRPVRVSQALGRSGPETAFEDADTGESMYEEDDSDRVILSMTSRQSSKQTLREQMEHDAILGAQYKSGKRGGLSDVEEDKLEKILLSDFDYDTYRAIRRLQQSSGESLAFSAESYFQLHPELIDIAAARKEELRKRDEYEAMDEDEKEQHDMEKKMGYSAYMEYLDTELNRKKALQMQISNHLLDDAQGGLVAVETENAERAREAYEKIGETPNGLEQTPVRNSGPAPTGKEAQQDSPFLDPRAKEQMFFDVSTVLNMASPQSKTAGDNPRGRRGVIATEISKSARTQKPTKSLQQLKKEADADPNDVYAQSLYSSAISAQEVLKRGEASKAESKKAKKAKKKK